MHGTDQMNCMNTYHVKQGGTGQLDRMFREPKDKRTESLRRITRNKKIYLAIFYKDEQTRCKSIYEIDPKVAAVEAERQLDRSRNQISHVGFSESWAKKNGSLVYNDLIARTPGGFKESGGP